MRHHIKLNFTTAAPQTLYWGEQKSPCGNLLIGMDETDAIRFIHFIGKQDVHDLLVEWQKEWKQAVFVAAPERTKQLVREIFSDNQQRYTLKLSGTDFQQQVWRAISKIPAGKTLSYSEIAASIGNPNAVRAVGTACGANPIPLLIPCHRVLASNGGLGGFGGGLAVKKLLLAAEALQKRAA